MHWRSAKESDARGADTDSRSYLPRAAPLARGPLVVLRLGHAAGDRRRPRGQQQGRSPRAVVPTVRRLAAGRAAIARLGKGWPRPLSQTRWFAGDLRRSSEALEPPAWERAGGRRP